MTREYPETIGESVRLLKLLLEPQDLASIRAMTADQLGTEHMGVALFIRNAFGLWKNNESLLQATGSKHPDDAALVILQALWRELRAGHTVLPH